LCYLILSIGEQSYATNDLELMRQREGQQPTAEKDMIVCIISSGRLV